MFSLCSPGFTEFLLSSRVLQLAIRIDLAALGFSFENKRILRRESRHLHGWVLVSFFRVSFQFSFVFFSPSSFSRCVRVKDTPTTLPRTDPLTNSHTHTLTHPHTHTQGVLLDSQVESRAWHCTKRLFNKKKGGFWAVCLVHRNHGGEIRDRIAFSVVDWLRSSNEVILD